LTVVHNEWSRVQKENVESINRHWYEHLLLGW
jgi:hypothetical protein